MMASVGYGALDRLLYRIAFSGVELQKALADVEDRLLPAGTQQEDARPVFVTSLPRAGTTLLLTTLAQAGFASHTYRDMPFILCPLLWARISQPFLLGNRTQERAHGDGMTVGFDSPEAFEEMVWKAFWGHKYMPQGIALWTAQDRDTDFEDFFRSHIRKISVLRANSGATRRYLSKNNANIARIPLLKAIFPAATILAPLRNPVDHASALLRQHLRFLEIHRRDRFAQKYMEAIGHLEFGALQRPLLFGGAAPSEADTRTLDYWLDYWIAAATHLLRLPAGDLHIVDYDAWCETPAQLTESLAPILDVHPGVLTATGLDLHPARRYDLPETIDSRRIEQALSLHGMLASRAINARSASR